MDIVMIDSFLCYIYIYIAGVEGTVKYVGNVSFGKGTYLGVELDTPGIIYCAL